MTRRGIVLAAFAFAASIIPLQRLSHRFAAQPPGDEAAPIARPYAFTTDWFTKRIPVWQSLLAEFKDRPDVRYLEVGIYEGRSALWVLENILSHPTSRMTCVDVFPDRGVERRFFANLKLSGLSRKVTVLKGLSGVRLRELPLRRFDIIYIDASHTADDVMTDAVLAWGLLATGGILIFDDYLIDLNLPSELRPKIAVDAFLAAFKNESAVLHRGYQLFVRKTENPCGGPVSGKSGCSPIGPFVYRWDEGRLSRTGNGRNVNISSEEKACLERLLLSRDSSLAVPSKAPSRTDAECRPLRRRLEI